MHGFHVVLLGNQQSEATMFLWDVSLGIQDEGGEVVDEIQST
jgi:hypothetical protein